MNIFLVIVARVLLKNFHCYVISVSDGDLILNQYTPPPTAGGIKMGHTEIDLGKSFSNRLKMQTFIIDWKMFSEYIRESRISD